MSFDLQDYLAKGVEVILKGAARATLKNPKQGRFVLKFSRHALKANKIRQQYDEKGRNIPVFLIASVTSRCNLHCAGCYSRANDNEPSNQLSADEWEDIFTQARDLGISFIVLAGGEPLLRRDVILKARKFPEILFPIFTNGTMLDDDYLKLFDENRNLVPVISIEGDESLTDLRRGQGVYKKLVNGMEQMGKRNLAFGASLTFSKANLTGLLSNEFIENLHDLGCKVVFFIEYVPMNGEMADMAPGDSERELLFGQIESLRQEFSDMLFLTFPGDEKTSEGCLAAGRGFFHINSHGGAEPCPASPYSDINVRDTSILEALDSNFFKSLRDGGILADDHVGGCVLAERKEDVERLLEEK